MSTSLETAPVTGPGLCAAAGLHDLSLLTHLAAQGMRSVLDRICREHGLKDARDWFVLHALSDGIPRTQLEIAKLVCIDKTTLTALLDRLEDVGFIVRVTDKHDRRARIPQSTEAGRKVFDAVAEAHDSVQQALLADVSPEQSEQFYTLLTRCAAAGDAPGCPGGRSQLAARTARETNNRGQAWSARCWRPSFIRLVLGSQLWPANASPNGLVRERDQGSRRCPRRPDSARRQCSGDRPRRP